MPPLSPQPCDPAAPASLFSYYFVTAPANASAASLAVELNPAAASNSAAALLGAFFNATLMSQQPGGSSTSVEFPALSCFWGNLEYALQTTLSSTLLGQACITSRRRALGGGRSLQPATYLGVSVLTVGSLTQASLPSASPAPTVTPAAAAAAINIGAIVGGVLGGLAFVCIVAFVAHRYWRRRKAAVNVRALQEAKLAAQARKSSLAALSRRASIISLAPGPRSPRRSSRPRHLVARAADDDAGAADVNMSADATMAVRRLELAHALAAYKKAKLAKSSPPSSVNPAAAAAAVARKIELASRSQSASTTRASADGSNNPFRGRASASSLSPRTTSARPRAPAPTSAWSNYDAGFVDSANPVAALHRPVAPPLVAASSLHGAPQHIVAIPMRRRTLLSNMLPNAESPATSSPAAMFMHRQRAAVVHKFSPDGQILEDGHPRSPTAVDIRVHAAGTDARSDISERLQPSSSALSQSLARSVSRSVAASQRFAPELGDDERMDASERLQPSSSTLSPSLARSSSRRVTAFQRLAPGSHRSLSSAISSSYANAPDITTMVAADMPIDVPETSRHDVSGFEASVDEVAAASDISFPNASFPDAERQSSAETINDD